MRRYAFIIPNLLSFLRLICAVVFPFCPERVWIWLVIGAGVSDILDGYLARLLKVESWLGGLLDGISDKLFVLVALMTFVKMGKFSFLWLPLVLARDLIVAGTAIYAAALKLWSSFQKMDVRWLGKAATMGQFLLFFTTLLFPDNILIVLWVACLISILAACDYGYLFVLALRERQKKLALDRSGGNG